MAQANQDELKTILENHRLWLLRDPSGQRADLRDACLRGADLRGAYLRDADLRGAHLQRADLRGAYLRGAAGCNKHRTTHLYGMLDQIGPIRAYKVVTDKWTGPHYPTITYRIGEEYEADVLMDDNKQCGVGINLATLDWCINNWEPGYHILIAEFEITDPSTDICIPIASDGKFRVRKCKIVGEKNLEELGLAERKEV